MKKTYSETLKDNIDSNFFQKEITNDFDAQKLNKKVKIGMTVGFSLLGFFILAGIVLLCLINVIKINKSDIIFGLSGAMTILVGICVVFIVPCCNFKIIHNAFKKTYDFDKQNKYLKLALTNLENLEVKNIFVDSQNHLTLNLVHNQKEYKLVYFNDYYELYETQSNTLIKKANSLHNFNQLIKVYYSDLDKTSFTSLNSFTLCMEIKLKKFAKLIISDFVECIGDENGNN